MRNDANAAAAVLSALALADEHGGAGMALAASGIELPEAERFVGLADDVGSVLGKGSRDEVVAEALALGFLAGRVAHRRRMRTAADPTSFLMDRELVVQGAVGESILRLPWFEDELFVGRQLPDIAEMPTPVRRRCIHHYSAALAGERGRFAFTSYGHAYTVDAVPVRGDAGAVHAVLGIALPLNSYASAAGSHDRTARALEEVADCADQRAARSLRAGQPAAARAAQRSAATARRNAERAHLSAERLRARLAPGGFRDAPAITPRETEVLELASHGLTAAEVAEQLVVSVGTVKTHLQNVYPKLGVNDKAAAVAAALRHGLID